MTPPALVLALALATAADGNVRVGALGHFAVRRRVEGVDVLALWRRNIPVGPEQLVEFPVLVAEVLLTRASAICDRPGIRIARTDSTCL